MSQPKGFRRLENLPPGDREKHDRMCATVQWVPLVSFDREALSLPEDAGAVDALSEKDRRRIDEDHGDQPYEPGLSLMGKERRGFLSVFYAETWAGGLQITASDGTGYVHLMIDRQQALLLAVGLWRWRRGTVTEWVRKLPKKVVGCRKCKSLGFIVEDE